MQAERKMALWKVLVIAAALYAGNVSAKKVQRIIRGEDATIEDFPYQASLRRGSRHFCGASIVSQRHIITAGHCAEEMYPPFNFYKVATGTSTRSNGNLHEIAEVIVHPEYFADSNRALNDIAVITLKDDIIFDEYQQKINLPEQNFKVGDVANVTGWGLINQIPAARLDQLQKIEAEIISQEECQKQMSDPEKIKTYDTEVCTARKKDSGVCTGDSGGPLVANGELVGIVSWSDGLYCAADHPDVFTNVYKFKDFIESAKK